MERIKHFTLKQEIGSGSYAQVFLGLNEQTKELVAIKKIRMPEQNKIQDIDREIAVLLTLNNPNIIKLIDCEVSQSHIYLILEFCCLGDLEVFMKKQYPVGGFPEDLAQFMMQQLQYALIEMSSKQIIHRDLKLSNILVNDKMEIKIADFGFAKYQQSEKYMHQSHAGTPLTMAPEVLKSEKYNEKCDIWSLGVILYQMIFGVLPFSPGPNQGIMSLINIIEELKTKPLKFPTNKDVSDDIKELIASMLKYYPDDRISLEQFVNNNWVGNKIDEDLIKKKYSQCFQNNTYIADPVYFKYFGKYMRQFVEENLKKFFKSLEDFIRNIQQNDDLYLIADIMEQIQICLKELKHYHFRINDQIVPLHDNALKMISNFQRKLPQNIMQKKHYQQVKLKNDSGIKGISNHMLKIFLQIVGLVQQQKPNTQNKNSELFNKMRDFLSSNKGGHGILQEVVVEGKQKDRIKNIQIQQAYHGMEDNKMLYSDMYQEPSLQKQQSHKRQNQNIANHSSIQSNYNINNILNQFKNQENENVDMIDVDEDAFEEDDIDDQIPQENQNSWERSIYEYENEELDQKDICFSIVNQYSPFFNFQEVENINLVYSMCTNNNKIPVQQQQF